MSRDDPWLKTRVTSQTQNFALGWELKVALHYTLHCMLFKASSMAREGGILTQPYYTSSSE
ncbi:hypothetical protein BGX21_000213, partial [Mortierella sp. AD011]